jgi:hypothetical protein
MSACHDLVGALCSGPDARDRDRIERVRGEIEEIRRRRAGDQPAMQRAIMEYNQRNPVAAGCLRPLARRLAMLLVPRLPILWTARRQDAFEWLAGIVVVADEHPEPEHC